MAREWKPGDVAEIVNAYGVTQRAIRGERRWVVPGDEWWDHRDEAVNIARPLVVIDPEDREQVDRLRRLCPEDWCFDADADTRAEVTAHLQTALREFANPTPPRIPEPGLWAVVEATVEGIPRRRWVHHEEDRWVCDTGERRYWDDLIDPELRREGVTA